MRVAKQTFLILLMVLGWGLIRQAWKEIGEGNRGLVAGIIVGLVLGSVGTLSWLSFSPDEEEKTEKKPE